MRINWDVRVRNKTFWVTLVPIILLLISNIFELFGWNVDFTEIQEKILNIISVIFLLLGVLGISNDPTTYGISDSEQALKYDEPKKS